MPTAETHQSNHRFGRMLFAAAIALAAALPAALDKEPGAAVRVSRAASGPGRATFVTCQTSMESGWKECQIAADPRAHALGILIETER